MSQSTHAHVEDERDRSILIDVNGELFPREEVQSTGRAGSEAQQSLEEDAVTAARVSRQ